MKSYNRKIAILAIIILEISLLSMINADQLKLTKAQNSNYPGSRFGHSMVFNVESNEIILFGGILANGDRTPLPYVWRYNFINQEWHKIAPEPSPSPRFNHGMVYIPIDHIVLIYGGVNTTNHEALGDTWIYNPRTNGWENKNPEVSPPNGSDSALIYDSQRHRVLLFGGFHGGALYDDLWEYDINSNNWTKLNDINNPSARYGHSLIYNNLNNMTYLFAGSTPGLKNNLWEYNQSSLSWNLISCVIKPATRYWHRMSYISHLNVGFLFGGCNLQALEGVLDDTWIFSFNNTEWIEQYLESSPSPRTLFSMIYNNDDKKVYLYGGIGESYTKTWNDFWVFDFKSNQWGQIHAISPFLKFIRDYWWVLVSIAAVGVASIIGIILLKKRQKDKIINKLEVKSN